MKSQRLLIALTVVNLGLLVSALHPEGRPERFAESYPRPGLD